MFNRRVQAIRGKYLRLFIPHVTLVRTAYRVVVLVIVVVVCYGRERHEPPCYTQAGVVLETRGGAGGVFAR